MLRWAKAHPIGALLLALALLAMLLGGMSVYRLSQQVNLAGVIGSGARVQIQLPDGFQAQVFARDLSRPRFIAFGPDGALYVAERGADRIIRIPDLDKDGSADGVVVVAEDLKGVHSLEFQGGDLYAGVPTGVVLLQDRDNDGSFESRSTLISNYPTGGHNTRTVLFLPTGEMVVSVGSSCNSCVEDDPRRAALLRYDPPNFSDTILHATGLRNAVGLAIQPSTGDLWVSNNGRDMMGPDVPPDTVHRIQPGTDYGWPQCHAGAFPDPDLGGEDSCGGVPAPDISIQAHSAPLGLVFYDGDQFPAEYRGDLFIAYHGSWNREPPTGYKVVRVPFEGARPVGDPQDFATGWFEPSSREVSGRPVGLAVDPLGSLYISDDRAGFIYRISYQP